MDDQTIMNDQDAESAVDERKNTPRSRGRNHIFLRVFAQKMRQNGKKSGGEEERLHGCEVYNETRKKGKMWKSRVGRNGTKS